MAQSNKLKSRSPQNLKKSKFQKKFSLEVQQNSGNPLIESCIRKPFHWGNRVAPVRDHYIVACQWGSDPLVCQVVCSNKEARKRLTESNGTSAMDLGHMNFQGRTLVFWAQMELDKLRLSS